MLPRSSPSTTVSPEVTPSSLSGKELLVLDEDLQAVALPRRDQIGVGVDGAVVDPELEVGVRAGPLGVAAVTRPGDLLAGLHPLADVETGAKVISNVAAPSSEPGCVVVEDEGSAS